MPQERKQLTKQIVELDGQFLTDTDFIECVIVYKGGTVPVIRDCAFRQCNWRMEGQALNTVDFLRHLIHAGGDSSGARDFVLREILGVGHG